MSNQRQPGQQEKQILQLMLIDNDPVFHLGLVTCLEQHADLQVVLEADSVATAMDRLQTLANASSEMGSTGLPLDLVLLDLDMGQRDRQAGLLLCQQLHASYPDLPILLVGTRPDPGQLATAFQLGTGGYCPKASAIAELVTAIRQVARGQAHWTAAMDCLSQYWLDAKPIAPMAISQTRSSFSLLRRTLRLSGLRQIDRAIADLTDQLQQSHLPALEHAILAGRQRELRAARWLVNRLLATPDDPRSPSPEVISASLGQPSRAAPVPLSLATSEVLTPDLCVDTSGKALQAVVIDAIATRFQFSLRNTTDIALEIDILKEEKKRELLYSILRKLEEILDELRFSQVKIEQLSGKIATILRDLWQAAIIEFIGKYYTLPLGDRTVVLVDILLQDVDIVQTEILNKIPLVQDVLAHLLFQTPLTIDDTAYAAGSVEAMTRLEILLQHLIIQVANAVIQPLLNRVGNVVEIKQSFYDKRLLSTREVERFRNNLSWRYRVENYIGEPTAIFESRRSLFSVQAEGLVKLSIYAPRNQELDQLSGVQLAVTIVLETRDAIAPRLQSAISFLGSGVVYMLTEVIGRGIGLIGRGILKGIGNAFQDVKLSRNRERLR
jgi:DNA-binding NarL/FixJ family response regulator